MPALLALEPVPELLRRARGELAHVFAGGRPLRVARAPGRLDVMGGVADYTGSVVCELPLRVAAAAVLQRRDDGQAHVVSLDLLDAHRPFTLTMPVDTLARAPLAELRAGFAADRGRRFAAYLLGPAATLHEAGVFDLTAEFEGGFTLAVKSDVPSGAGLSSSAALEVACAMVLCADAGVLDSIDPVRLAALCQRAENLVAGAPCGVMDQVAACCGEAGALMRLRCQPHELMPPLALPAGVRVVGIDSDVKHNVRGGAYGRTRVAAAIGHTLVVEEMRRAAAARGLTLASDPTGGYLANLDQSDYLRLFRGALPEQLAGDEFLDRYGKTADPIAPPQPGAVYHVQAATDHHVMEARRVRDFCRFVEEAAALEAADPARKLALDKAGHLMYASHASYGENAQLGAPECDALVELVRQHERGGALFGAKITGGGSGGTVAVLCAEGAASDAALDDVMRAYAAKTGRRPKLFAESGPGAWQAGTASV